MTGDFTNWAGKIADIGPIYPFVGSEGLLVIVGVALWLGWHIMQTKQENQEHRESVKHSKEELDEIINRN
jgi:hypothetical protein